MRLSLLSASLVAVCLLAAPARAASKFGLDGLMSTVMQENQSSISGFAVRARLHPAMLIDNIVLMPTLEWWRSSSHVDPYGIESVRSDNTLSMDARYEFRRPGFIPYVGGGIGVHFLSSRVDAPSLGIYDATKSLTKGSFSLLGGVTIPLTTKVQNFLELKYHHVSDYRQLKLNWGIAVEL
ncbi:MAG: outer membrane beta-barrel protein [Candidatus Eisenbacteria bacterium]|nr:outer membrane beta-barrel protein [Candidatus Eisenbacteria bacterium]